MEFWDVMGIRKSRLWYTTVLQLILTQHFLIKLLKLLNVMGVRKFTWGTQMACNENYQNYIETLTVLWDLENLA